MVIAEIYLVDGDRIEMPFERFDTLALWMEDEVGTYTGVNARVEGNNDAVRYDT